MKSVSGAAAQGELPLFAFRHTYRACGCGLRSTVPLPELLSWQGAVDVEIVQQTVELPCDVGAERRDAYCLCVRGDSVWLRWRAVGTLLIRQGTEMCLDALPEMEEKVLRLFILGAGLGVILYQRHRLALHASAVSVGGQGVVFVGVPGLGKSTTAAALYERGAPIHFR